MTWIGPRHVIENEEPLVDHAGGNMGAAADGWIRERIEALNLAHRDALFPIQLWNMTDRLALGLSRTNNSLEGWHAIWNAHLKGNQRLSGFVRKMIEEDEMWSQRIIDYQIAPADGIRGPHAARKGKYVRQDNNLNALFQDIGNRDPLEYLRACAYHLHF